MRLDKGTPFQAFTPNKQAVVAIAAGEYHRADLRNAIALNWIATAALKYTLHLTASETVADDFDAEKHMWAAGGTFGIDDQYVAYATFKNENTEAVNLYLEWHGAAQ